MRLGAVIAAAGLSSRMGAFKPLLPLGDSTVIGRGIATLQAAGVEDIVVVTGHRAAELEAYLMPLGVRLVRNERYAETEMFDSLRMGFHALPERCEGLFFTPGDVPLFTAETLLALARSGAELACPQCRGRKGHPIFLTRETALRLLADSGEDGLRGTMARCGIPLGRIRVEDEGVLMDADTPQAYERLAAMTKQGRP